MVTFGTIDVTEKTVERLFFSQVKDMTLKSSKKTRWSI